MLSCMTGIQGFLKNKIPLENPNGFSHLVANSDPALLYELNLENVLTLAHFWACLFKFKVIHKAKERPCGYMICV